jgi:hypothetical protein
MFLVRPRIRQLTRIFKSYYSTKPSLSNLTKSERVEFLRQMALPKSRENPVILKLDTPDYHSLFTDELKSLASMFKEHGYEIRIAGGAVRDLLSGVETQRFGFCDHSDTRADEGDVCGGEREDDQHERRKTRYHNAEDQRQREF